MYVKTLTSILAGQLSLSHVTTTRRDTTGQVVSCRVEFGSERLS